MQTRICPAHRVVRATPAMAGSSKTEGVHAIQQLAVDHLLRDP